MEEETLQPTLEDVETQPAATEEAMIEESLPAETVLEETSSAESETIDREDATGEALEEETQESMADDLESTAASSEPAVVLPDTLQVDSLTIQVSEGVVIEGLLPDAEEEEEDVFVPVAYANGSALSLSIPDNYVVFTLGQKQLVFPSGYVDDLLLVDGYLVNMGSAVTIAVNLSETASVSNYIVSQVTFPTYGSSDYISYVTSYGAPYRIVDRYRNSNGNISSYTRTSSAAMTAQEIVQPGWYGFSGGRMYGYIFAVVLIFILIWGRMRWKH